MWIAKLVDCVDSFPSFASRGFCAVATDRDDSILRAAKVQAQTLLRKLWEVTLNAGTVLSIQASLQFKPGDKVKPAAPERVPEGKGPFLHVAYWSLQ